MSLVADAAVWRSLITIFGAMFVGSHTFKTQFVFLKKVFPFFEGQFSELVTRSVCESLFREKDRVY